MWCAAINAGVLVPWFLAFALARDWVYRHHGKLFLLSRDTFTAVHYSGMMPYRLAILMLNPAPFIVLRIAG